MVDAISGGRLEFGVGRGNRAIDYQMLEIDRDESRARFEEAMDVITGVWSNDRCSHDGRYWQFEDVSVYPRPIQQPLPSIWVAGNSPESAAWAGRHGYHLMTVAHPRPPEPVRMNTEAWKASLPGAAAGGRPHCQLLVRVWVEESAERAKATAELAYRRYDELSAFSRERQTIEEPDLERMFATGRNIYGNPEQCIQGIRNAAKHFEFDTLAAVFNFGGIPHERVMTAMQLFAREVMPAFQ